MASPSSTPPDAPPPALVKQLDSTLIRIYDDFGYVYNRVSKLDRIYDTTGAAYLRALSRTPRRIDDLARELAPSLPAATPAAVEAALRRCLADLEADGSVALGNDAAELAAKEPRFSYRSGTLVDRRASIQPEAMKKNTDSCDFFFDYFSKKPLLFRIHIDVTARCNEKCRHCYLPLERAKLNLDTGVAMRVLDEIRDMNTFSVTFSGGEAFLHPHFDRILRKARENDFAITVLSNGTTITDQYFDVLKEVQIDEMQFTLFSMNPEEHDYITRVPGSHERTMRTIERVIESDIPLKISCPIMKVNRHAFKDVARWAWPHGIDVNTDFVLFACTDFASYPLENRLSLAEAEELIRDMIEHDPAYRRFLDFRDPPIDPRTLASSPCCGAGRDTICLDANGDYFFCPLFRRKLGNAHSDRLKDLWAGTPAIEEIRRTSWSDFPKCMGCDAFHFCSMCFARNYNEGRGDIFKINEHCCDIAFLNKRLVEEYWSRTAPAPHAT
ncbi:MAG: radical SAM protein [Polyangiaceae bacterium]|nr:radical SAM protein [Polyangiaceae bacterium]